MPAKKPMSEEDKDLVVRQEGRRGFLRVKQSKIVEIGERNMRNLFGKIRFQVFAEHSVGDTTIFYGYCPLFAPLSLHEKTLNYVMRVNMEKPDPIVEMFIVEDKT